MSLKTPEQLKTLNGLVALWLKHHGIAAQEVHDIHDSFEGSGSGGSDSSEDYLWLRYNNDMIDLETRIRRLELLEYRVDDIERKPAVATEKTSGPPLGWLFVGVVIGIIIASIVFKGF